MRKRRFLTIILVLKAFLSLTEGNIRKIRIFIWSVQKLWKRSGRPFDCSMRSFHFISIYVKRTIVDKNTGLLTTNLGKQFPSLLSGVPQVADDTARCSDTIRDVGQSGITEQQ